LEYCFHFSFVTLAYDNTDVLIHSVITDVKMSVHAVKFC
jgi:hypothetical protein